MIPAEIWWLLPLVVYAIGWPVAYRHQYVKNETARRRKAAADPTCDCPKEYPSLWARGQRQHNYYCRQSGNSQREYAPSIAFWVPFALLAVAFSFWEGSQHTHTVDGHAVITGLGIAGYWVGGSLAFLTFVFAIATCDDEVFSTDKYGRTEPLITAHFWPLYVLHLAFSLIARVFRFVWTLGGRQSAGALNGWLRPEIKIPDPDRIRELENQ